MQLYTQLNFGGNCEEAFRFYEQHLGGRIVQLVRASEMPGGTPPGNTPNAVIHARLEIANTLLIANDVPAGVHQPMRSAYLYLSVDSAAEAERIYSLLSEGGEVFMPLAEQFFAERFAMLRDRFGVSWALIRERQG